MTWAQGLFNVLCNLISVAIVALFSGKKTNMDTGFWQVFFDFKLNYAVFFIVVNFLFVLIVTNRQKKHFEKRLNSARHAEAALRDISDSLKDKETSQWGYGKHVTCGAVQIHDTWQQWLSQLIKVTERLDLEPHNFGDHFYLYDLTTCEIIDFPKEKHVREAKIGNRFHVGKTLRVMPRID